MFANKKSPQKVEELIKDDENEGIYTYDILDVEKKEEELIRKYPEQASKIRNILHGNEKELSKK